MLQNTIAFKVVYLVVFYEYVHWQVTFLAHAKDIDMEDITVVEFGR